jgi:hypothetical protein
MLELPHEGLKVSDGDMLSGDDSFEGVSEFLELARWQFNSALNAIKYPA